MKWYDRYQNAEYRVAFIQKYQHLDFANGGKLNLCNLTVLKSLWKEMYPKSEEFPYISVVQHYFRDGHIAYMYKLKSEGKSPNSLLALGFSAKNINKYWDNRELAERIVGFKLP